jgi:hypothetical protein
MVKPRWSVRAICAFNSQRHNVMVVAARAPCRSRCTSYRSAATHPIPYSSQCFPVAGQRTPARQVEGFAPASNAITVVASSTAWGDRDGWWDRTRRPAYAPGCRHCRPLRGGRGGVRHDAGRPSPLQPWEIGVTRGAVTGAGRSIDPPGSSSAPLMRPLSLGCHVTGSSNFAVLAAVTGSSDPPAVSIKRCDAARKSPRIRGDGRALRGSHNASAVERRAQRQRGDGCGERPGARSK